MRSFVFERYIANIHEAKFYLFGPPMAECHEPVLGIVIVITSQKKGGGV